MQKLKTFFYSVFKSSTSPAYYFDILRAKASFSWQYFLFFHLFLALLVAGQVSLPIAQFDLKAASNEVVALFPSDLRLEFKQGKLSINQPLPYRVPMPGMMARELEPEAAVDRRFNDKRLAQLSPKYLVTVTSDEEISGLRDVYELESVAVLTETTAYVMRDEDSGRFETIAYPSSQENFVIDAQLLKELQLKVLDFPIIKNKLYVPLFAAALFLVVYPFMVLWRLFTLVLLTVLVYILVALFLRSRGLSFGQVYRLGMHAITPLVLIRLIIELVNRPLFSGWTYIAVFVGWMLVIISQLPASGVGVAPAGAMTSSKATMGSAGPSKSSVRSKK